MYEVADAENNAATDISSAVVLGAGISGLVAASILVKQGHRNVIVIDEYAQVGGNHIDRTIGPYTFDIGSLIFQDDSPLVNHFPELLPHYVAIKPTWGRLNPQGVVTAYPISIRDDLIAAGPFEWMRFISSVAYARLFHRKIKNARDFARYWIGARLLYRSGLGNYMHRFYGLPAEYIDIEFAEKRMLWIKEHALVRTHVARIGGMFRAKEPAAPSNLQLVRPREGFALLYRDAVARLERDGVKFVLGAQLHSIERQDQKLIVKAGDIIVAANRVVSTIPIDRIQKLCGIIPAKKLQNVTLISLFFSFAGKRGFKDAVLYNFSHTGAWKRLTVYSDFYGLAGGREYFTVEVNADHVNGSVKEAAENFRSHTSENGLFSGDLNLEGSHVLSNAYPVYTEKADETAAQAISALRRFGVLSFGRQGGFEYQPTARVSTHQAEKALQQA